MNRINELDGTLLKFSISSSGLNQLTSAPQTCPAFFLPNPNSSHFKMFRWKFSSHQVTHYRSNQPSNLLYQNRKRKAYQNLLKYSKFYRSVHLVDPRRTQRAVQNLLTPTSLRGSHQYRDGYKGNSLLQAVRHPSAEGTGELVTPSLKAGGWQVFSKRSFSQQLILEEILCGFFPFLH